MKNRKLILLSLVLVFALVFAAGCGSNDNKTQQAQQPMQPMQQQQDAHSGHSMPSGDPMPMMKDMDKAMQDMTRQVKAGQMMDAQKSALQMAGLADKVMPHISDPVAKEAFQKAANDLRDTMNGGKMDQMVVEGKMKAMQDAMAAAMKNLQAGAHH